MKFTHSCLAMHESRAAALDGRCPRWTFAATAHGMQRRDPLREPIESPRNAAVDVARVT